VEVPEKEIFTERKCHGSGVKHSINTSQSHYIWLFFVIYATYSQSQNIR